MSQVPGSAFSGAAFRGRNESSCQNDNSENLPQICCNKETQLTDIDDSNTETDQKLLYLDNIDSFLVVDQTSGKVDIMPANFEQRPRLLCQFDRPIKLTFNPLYGSLIILDERYIGFRRDYNWAYSIGTLLDRPGSKSTRLEIPCDEALELYAFFSAPQPVKGIEWSEFKHLSDFTDQLSVKTAENYSVSEKSSIIVKIADGRRLLNDLLVITETLIEKKDYIYPIFPHALAIMERLRFSLFPQHPYSVQKPHVSLVQRRINKSANSDKFCKSLLHSEGARRLTFFKWPHTNFKYAIPTQMAEAGFFHQSNEMNADRVLCYICNVCLVSWEPSDEPYQEHERHSAACRFINNPSLTNVPLGLTMSSLAPFQWNWLDLFSGHESAGTRQLQNVALSASTSNCDWFAMSGGEANVIGSQRKPLIRLYHLDKITQSTYYLVVDVNDTFLEHTLSNIAFATQNKTEPATPIQHRRAHRVTWRDSEAPVPIQDQQHESGRVEHDTGQEEKGPPGRKLSDNSAIGMVEVTALCCAGIRPQSLTAATEQHSSEPEPAANNTGSGLDSHTKVTAVLLVGTSIDDARLSLKNAKQSQCNTTETSEVSSLNSVNSIMAQMGDRILPGSINIPETGTEEVVNQQLNESQLDKHRPLILVYHIVESFNTSSADQSNQIDAEMQDNIAIEDVMQMKDSSEGATSIMQRDNKKERKRRRVCSASASIGSLTVKHKSSLPDAFASIDQSMNSQDKKTTSVGASNTDPTWGASYEESYKKKTDSEKETLTEELATEDVSAASNDPLQQETNEGDSITALLNTICQQQEGNDSTVEYLEPAEGDEETVGAVAIDLEPPLAPPEDGELATQIAAEIEVSWYDDTESYDNFYDDDYMITNEGSSFGSIKKVMNEDYMDDNISTMSKMSMPPPTNYIASDQATVSTVTAAPLDGPITIHYEQRTTSTIVMQCFRLPEELDSTNFRIDHIVASEANNGFAVVGVNRRFGEEVDDAQTTASAVVVYARLEYVNMLQEACINRFSFGLCMGRISQITLLSSDYFFAYRSSCEQNNEGKQRSPGLNAEAVTIHSAVLRFSTGKLVLLDLNSGKYIEFLEDKHAVDITLAEDDAITVLCKDGSIHTCRIKPLVSPRLRSDEDEQIALNMLQNVDFSNETQSLEHQLETTFAGHPRLLYAIECIKTCLANQPVTLDSLSKLWQLTRADSSAVAGTGYGSRESRKLPVRAAENNSQAASGFHMHAPPQWIDSQHFHQRTHKRTSATSPSLANILRTGNKDFLEGQHTRLHNSKSFIFLNSVSAALGNSVPNISGNSSGRTLNAYVFELTILSGVDLAHINVTFKFSPFATSGTPAVQLSIFRPKSTRPTNSQSDTAHHVQSVLSQYSEKPDLLRNQTQQIIGPVQIGDFVDASNQSATIQLSAIQLLNMVKNDTKDFVTSETTETFYLLIESLSLLSSEQVLIQQTKTALLNGASPICVTGAGVKRSHANNDLHTNRPSYNQTHSGSSNTAMSKRKTNLAQKIIKGLSQSKSTTTLTQQDNTKNRIQEKKNLNKQKSALTSGAQEAVVNVVTCGMEWLEEISVIVYKAGGEPSVQHKSRLERSFLTKHSGRHKEILRLAAGLLDNVEHQCVIKERFLVSQCQALDILEWLWAQWQTETTETPVITAFLDYMLADSSHILHMALLNGYIFAPRTIAHKFTIIICGILGFLNKLNAPALEKVLISLLTELKTLFGELHRIEKAGSLHWLFSFIVYVIKISATSFPDSRAISNAVNELLFTSVQMLGEVGKHWKRQWEDDTPHIKLANKYNLAGMPMEQMMFDYPITVLSIISRPIGSDQINNCQHQPSTGAALPKSGTSKYGSLQNWPQQNWTLASSMNYAPTSNFQHHHLLPQMAVKMSKHNKKQLIGSGAIPSASHMHVSVPMPPFIPVVQPSIPYYQNLPPPATSFTQSGALAHPQPSFVQPIPIPSTFSSTPLPVPGTSAQPVPGKMYLYYYCNAHDPNSQIPSSSSSISSPVFTGPLAIASGSTMGTPYYVPSKLTHPLSTSHGPAHGYFHPVGGVIGGNTGFHAPPHQTTKTKKIPITQTSSRITPTMLPTVQSGNTATISQASAFLCKEYAIDEISWLELFFATNNNATANDQQCLKTLNENSANSEGFGTKNEFGDLSGNEKHWYTRYRDPRSLRFHGSQQIGIHGDAGATGDTKRVILGSEHLPGLLEVEPLGYVCLYGSDHMRVVNKDSGSITQLASEKPNEESMRQVNSKKMALKDDASAFSTISTTSHQIINKAEAKNLADMYSLKHQLQYQQHLLSKHRQHFGAGDVPLGSSGGTQPASEGSSASTFGVPTTPKTTPFLTPIPLSPISSEDGEPPVPGPVPATTDTTMTTEPTEESSESTMTEKKDEILNLRPRTRPKRSRTVASNYGPQTGKPLTASLFSPPEILSLAAERMTAGARKFVVIDFGTIVLLTDVLLPACEYTNNVQVETWCVSEHVDCVRLLYSNDIGNKSVALADMQQPVLCRYARVTYTVRQLYNNVCTIPLGRFHGTRFFSAWQAYGCVNSHMLKGAISTTEIGKEHRNLGELLRLAEQMRTNYEQSCVNLRQCLRENRHESLVRAVYRECVRYRVEWNCMSSLVQRLEQDRQPISSALSMTEGNGESWSKCGADQLRVVAGALLGLLNDSSSLLELRANTIQHLHTAEAARNVNATSDTIATSDQAMDEGSTIECLEASAFPSLLNLDSAVQFFDYFCCQSPLAQLQAQYCSLLFTAGHATHWWPDFFPTVLTNHFNSMVSSKKLDNVFLLLSYLYNETVKQPALQSPVMGRLFEFVINQLGQPADLSDKIDASLLSWTFLLISSAFDIVVTRKRRNDRWTFLTGELGLSNTASSSTLSRGHTGGFCGAQPYYETPSWTPTKSLAYKGPISKNTYKKLSEQLEKMKQMHSLSSSNTNDLLSGPEAKIEKLKHRLKSLQSIYAAFKQQSSSQQSSSAMNEALGTALSETLTAATESNDSLGQSSAAPEDDIDLLGALHDLGGSKSNLQQKPSTSEFDDYTVGSLSDSSALPPPHHKKGVFGAYSSAKKSFGFNLKPSLGGGFKSTSWPPPLPQFGKYDSKEKTQPGNALHRQQKQLMLETTLCLRLIQSVLALLCEKSTQLPLATQLIAMKVISKVCVHGSEQPIPLSAAINSDYMQSLISRNLDDAEESPWLRQGLLALLIDVSEAELKVPSAKANKKSEKNEKAATDQSIEQRMEIEDEENGQANLSNEVEAKRRKEEDSKDEEIEKLLQQALSSGDSDKSLTPETTYKLCELPTSSSAADASRVIADSLVSGAALQELMATASSILEPQPIPMECYDTISATHFDQKAQRKSLLASLQTNFEVQCRLSAEDVHMQPVAVAVGSTAESQLGLTAQTECRRMALLKDTLNRWALRRVAATEIIGGPVTSNNKGDVETKQMTSEIGKCVKTVMDTFNILIESLANPAEVAPGFPERLLDFYWHYHANVAALLNTKQSHYRISSPLFDSSVPSLSESAISALMTFAVQYQLMDELLWSQILKALNFSIREAPTLVIHVSSLPAFQPFLEAFCGGSLNKFNTFATESSFGPAVDRAFGHFIELLLKHPSTEMLNKIIDTLISVFSKDTRFGFGPCPVDALVELTEKLASSTSNFIQSCDVNRLVRLYETIMRFTKEYMAAFVKKDPRSQEERQFCLGYSSSTANHPANMCFRCVSPGSETGEDPSSKLPPTTTSNLEQQHQTLKKVLEIAKQSFPTDLDSLFQEDKPQSKKQSTMAGPKPAKSYVSLFQDYGSKESSSSSKQSNLANELSLTSMDIDDLGGLESNMDDYMSGAYGNRFCNLVKEPRINIHKDKHEIVIFNILKLVSTAMRLRKELCTNLLESHHQSIYDSLDILFNCRSAIPRLEEVSVENWKVVTVADMVLYSMLMISQSIGDYSTEAKKFLKLIIYRLRQCHCQLTMSRQCHGVRLHHRFAAQNAVSSSVKMEKAASDPSQAEYESKREQTHTLGAEPPLELSSPIAFLLIRLIQELMRKRLFIELGGHLFVAEQLQKSIVACTGDTWPPLHAHNSMSFAQLNRQLNAMTNHISGNQSSTDQQIEMVAKPANDPKVVDNLLNFAPLCTATSSSAMAHHLNSLLQNNVQHRKSRNPQWNYHFSGKEQWLDVTLTLPYPILLSEVVIKPHSSNLMNSPSAVQVELCSDPANSSWSPVRCPMSTLGLNRIAVPTSSYRNPVNAVRIYMKKPPESNNLGLMQIMILGKSNASLQSPNGSNSRANRDLMHWLCVFNKLCLVNPPVWNYAPRLPQALTKLFLNRPHPPDIYGLLHHVLLNIDYKSNKTSNVSVVNLIIDYIASGGLLCSQVYSSLAELLVTFCAMSAPTGRPTHVNHATAIARQRQLLKGIATMLEHFRSGLSMNETSGEEYLFVGSPDLRFQSMKALSMLMWAAACVLWKNISESSMRYDTIAMCLDLGPSMLRALAHLAADNDSDSTSQTAASWLLCSLVRAVPTHLNELLQFYKCSHKEEIECNSSAMFALRRICQSGTAVEHLKSQGLLTKWLQRAVQICQDTRLNESKMAELCSIVACLESLSVIDSILHFLESTEGGSFVQHLLRFVVVQSSQNKKLVKRADADTTAIFLAANAQLVKLQDSLLGLLKRCVSCSNSHRARTAQYLCDLLKSPDAVISTASSNHFDKFKMKHKLNPTLLKIIHQLVLEDEKIIVRFTDVVSSPENATEDGTESPSTSYSLEDRMLHPLFGCNPQDRVVDIPLYTQLDELLPTASVMPNVQSRRRRATGVDGELQHYSSMGGFGYTDIDEDFENFNFMSSDWNYGMPPYTSSGFCSGRPNPQKKSTTPTESTAQLLCDGYSQQHALKGKWTIGALFEGIVSSQRREHPSDGLNTHLNEMNLPKEVHEFNDGYSTITLKMSEKTSSMPIIKAMDGPSTSHAGMQSQVPSMTEFLENSHSIISTLQHFARSGGLYELSMHLHPYNTLCQLKDTARKLMSSDKLSCQQSGTSSSQISEITHGLMSAVTSAWEVLQKSAGSGCEIAEQHNEFDVEEQEADVLGTQDPAMQVQNDFSEAFVGETSMESEETSGGEIQMTPLSSASAMGPMFDIALMPSSSQIGPLFDFEMVDIPISGNFTQSDPLVDNQWSYSATMDDWDNNNSPFGPTWPGNVVSMDLQPPPSAHGMPAAGVLKSAMKSTTNSGAGGRFWPDGSGAPPPHVISTLGLLLRLDSFAELFVVLDRAKAKKLLQFALNISNQEKSVSDLVAGLRPAPPTGLHPASAGEDESGEPIWVSEHWPGSSSAISGDKRTPSSYKYAKNTAYLRYSSFDEYGRPRKDPADVDALQQLSLFPFLVLEKLLNSYSAEGVGADRAFYIRQRALELGIVDVLLICLAHFAHQQRNSPLPKGEQRHSQHMVQIIGHLLTANNCIEALREACAASAALQRQSADPYGYGPAGPASATAAQTAKTTSTSTSHQTTQPNYWAKGTGFGSGTTQQQWNVNQHIAKRKQDEENVACVLNIIRAFIQPQLKAEDAALISRLIKVHSKTKNEEQEVDNSSAGVTLPEQSATMIYGEVLNQLRESCICRSLHSYLMNDSVLDISKHVGVCEAVIALVHALAHAPPVTVVVDSSVDPTHQKKEVDMFTELFLTPQSGESETQQPVGRSILAQLTSLNKHIDIYLSKLNKQSKTEHTPQDVDDPEVQGSDEEGLANLLELSRTTCEAIKKKVQLLDEKESKPVEPTHENVDSPIYPMHLCLADPRAIDNIYCGAMKSLQFESIAFYNDDGSTLRVPYHYSSSLQPVGQTAGMAKRMRRLAQEIVTLSSSLPLSASSSVFVRASEERLDAMKVLITGPEDTPYSNGCFEFDVCFPPDFPNSPMMINLETTGNHTVRFNPNLYDDGKVCLSVLNTWRGRPEERWNPDTSTFLQVIVSIQSLILVNEPYFNEPGYERWRNTPAGRQASREYDANIRQQSVRWAMIEQIRHPSKAFADIVQRHFWLKRDQICEQVQEWIRETQAHVDSKVDSSKTLPTYLAGLKRQFSFLKEEFSRMKPPSGLEQYHSINFPSQQPTASPPQHNNATVAASDEITSPDNNLVQEQLEVRDNETVESDITWKLVPVDLDTNTDPSSEAGGGVIVQASQAS